MSLSATCAAYRATPGCPVAKLVLIELADWADERGRTLIVMDDLVRFTESTPERVAKALKGLASAGLIELGDVDHKGRTRALLTGVAA